MEIDDACPQHVTIADNGIRDEDFAPPLQANKEVPIQRVEVKLHVRVSELRFGRIQDGLLPFAISCTSGTYIRSIASELGEKLGCGAHLAALRRSRIGVFSASDAVALERFEAFSPAERLEAPHAVPLARVPFPFPRIQLASLEAWKIRRGQSVPSRGVNAREGEWVTLLGPSNDMLALGQVSPIGDRGVALIKPRIVLE